MDFIVPNFIRYQLYLLQLENYELARYWKLLRARGIFPRKSRPLRKQLVWTAKAKALLLMAVALHALIVIMAGLIVLAARRGTYELSSIIILTALVLLPFYFALFSFALVLIKPLDGLVKNRLVRKANIKIKKYQNLKIVGVAGSYGKTTMKEVLKEVLGIRYKVVATPESVNTPVGIARFVLDKVAPDTQVLILEMGEHYRGDIKQLCEIAPPDISVITGINEAHFERMGSLETIAATVFEAVEYAKEDALVVINGDDRRVSDNYQKFARQGQKVGRFSIFNFQFSKFNQQRLCWEAEAEGIGKIEINLLGEYALGDVSAAIAVARRLGLSDQEIKMGLLNVKPIEHRLQPIRSAGNVLVIDDSYNGNPDGAAEAIKVLSRFEGHRKIFITPGLVEAGVAAADIHHEIGRQLAGVVDAVILIRDSVTPFIEQGIRQQAAGKRIEIFWFNTAQEAHEGLKNILKPDDVILFQNDWGDQYI